ncbi:unnamed protein product [Notodromas monacha]|uniref:Uncharacterized protein n=1 Tax=Notodromas monacha TaxID=399045 RepID=A0A7R9GA15_9CRUS|nr:unnamed protein product [Notodromas monacha]CAG0913216.1 unnamed protein product [Notodromas monacha]
MAYFPGDKYRVGRDSDTVDGYQTLTRLKIMHIAQEDYRIYQCHARSSLGEIIGSVQLYEPGLTCIIHGKIHRRRVNRFIFQPLCVFDSRGSARKSGGIVNERRSTERFPSFFIAMAASGNGSESNRLRPRRPEIQYAGPGAFLHAGVSSGPRFRNMKCSCDLGQFFTRITRDF